MTGMPGWFPPRGGITRENAHLFYEVQGDCWICRSKPEQIGYVRVSYRGQRWMAHRATYDLFVGPIPDGLHVDHTCHNADLTCPGGNACRHRACMNPAHLEPVTRAENQHRMALRKTHCLHGHPFDNENTYIRADGASRTCKTCDRDHRRRYRSMRKLLADVVPIREAS